MPSARHAFTRIFILCAALCVVLLIGCSGETDPAEPSRSVVARLASLDSSITWVDTLRAVGDVDCDGTSDTTVVGHTSQSMHLGVVFGSAKPPHVLTIGEGPTEPDGVRGAYLTLEVGSQDYEPETDLEGFRRSSECVGLSLRDGDTDAYHTYWNHARGWLAWWRR